MAESKASGTSSPKAEATPPAKLSDDFVPNEPKPKTGTDADGKPDDTLSDSQAERAADEALLSLRPQPAVAEIKVVLTTLAEKDPKTGQPLKKFSSAKDAGSAAVDELNKLRGG